MYKVQCTCTWTSLWASGGKRGIRWETGGRRWRDKRAWWTGLWTALFYSKSRDRLKSLLDEKEKLLTDLQAEKDKIFGSQVSAASFFFKEMDRTIALSFKMYCTFSVHSLSSRLIIFLLSIDNNSLTIRSRYPQRRTKNWLNCGPRSLSYAKPIRRWPTRLRTPGKLKLKLRGGFKIIYVIENVHDNNE